MKDAKGHGSEKHGGVDQSKPLKDAGIIRAKGIRAMYGPGSPGYPTHPLSINGVNAAMDRARTAALASANAPGSPQAIRMTSAAQENVNIGKMIDETHYPSRTPSDHDAMKSLAQAGGPKATPAPVHPAQSASPRADAFYRNLEARQRGTVFPAHGYMRGDPGNGSDL